MDTVIHPSLILHPLLLIVVAIFFLAMARVYDRMAQGALRFALALVLIAATETVLHLVPLSAPMQLMAAPGGMIIAALLFVDGLQIAAALSGRDRGDDGAVSAPSNRSAVLICFVAAFLALVGLLWLGMPLATVGYGSAAVALIGGMVLCASTVAGRGFGCARVYASLLLWATLSAVTPFLGGGWQLVGGVIGGAALFVGVGIVLYCALRDFRDISHRRVDRLQALQLSAAQEAQRFQHLLEAMPEPLLILDTDGSVVGLNQAACTILCAPDSEIVGCMAQTLLHGEELDEQGGLSAVLQCRAAGGKGPGQEHFVLSLSRPGLADSLPVRMTVNCTVYDGKTLFLVVLRNLTEEQRSGVLTEFLHEMDRLVMRGGKPDDLHHDLCQQISDLFSARLVSIAVRDRAGAIGIRGAVGDGVTVADLVTLLNHSEWSNGVLHDVARAGGRLMLTAQDSPLPQALPVPLGWLVVLPLWGQTDVIGCLLIGGNSDQPDLRALRHMDTVASRLSNALQVIQDQIQLRLQGTALAAAANAIFITDVDGRIEWVNAAFTRLSGYEAQEVLGKTPSLLRSGMQDSESYRRFWDTIKSGRVWRGEMVERRKDGTLYTVDQTVAPILDDNNRIAHYVTVHEDITERKRAEERIAYLSNYDTLTRLPNRVLFRDHLYQAVNQARNNRTSLAVLFVDLDRFSRVNDTLGHDVGDQLLMTIASRINAVAAPEADTIARIGGDEFALIQNRLPNTEAAASLARKVIDAVNRPVDIGGLEVRVGTNVGIAIYPQDGEDPDHLIKNADMAMYRAVRSENEKCFFYSNEMNDEARARLALEGDLRRALDNGDLCLNFQPQVDVRSRRVVGVEALLRWNHPEQGMISPARFIPVAEDTGLILPIGDWVIQEAIRQSRAWKDEGLPPITVAINISAVQFQQSSLVRRVGDAIAGSGIDPAHIELELTESMLMQNANEAVRTLHELSGLGTKLAIDDFGTGYSSLSYLKQFPVDRLKLDQSFVRQMTTNSSDAVIARATINLGHSLGLEVIAEGVETEEQYAYLLAEGCDIVQGFLFGKPMAPDRVSQVLLRSGPGGLVDAGVSGEF